MSNNSISRIWSLDLDRGAQAVLLVLAVKASEGDDCPSVDCIAWMTGYSRRQVQRHLVSLRLAGLITAEAYESGGRGHCAEYSLHLENGKHKTPFDSRPPKAGALLRPDSTA